jgi:hypothetical protein
MKQIQQRVSQGPNLGKKQFDGISRSLPRCLQCSFAEPFGKRLAGAFGSGFDLGQLCWSQARSYRFGAKAGPSLISKRCLAPSRKRKFGSTHGKSYPWFSANAPPVAVLQQLKKAFADQCVYARCT